MYKFNVPTKFPSDASNLLDLIETEDDYSSDGKYTKLCRKILKRQTGALEVFLTPSGTSALEMMAQIIELKSDDEVIMPSYTFSSSGMAFINTGAKIVFVDINPNSGCISIDDLQRNITSKTKAILSVSYGGNLENQKELYDLCLKHNIIYLEDNAQSIGNIGPKKNIKNLAAMSCLSFHSTKNINSGGEGGALLINDNSFIKKAWIVRDKGTNRQEFLDGDVSKYQWVSKGGSHIMNEVSSSILASQLAMVSKVNKIRVNLCKQYRKNLSAKIKPFAKILNESENNTNGHIFALVLNESSLRNKLLDNLLNLEVQATSHYEPLHSSPANDLYQCQISLSGCKESSFLASRIVRLPMHYWLLEKDIKIISQKVIDCINTTYK